MTGDATVGTGIGGAPTVSREDDIRSRTILGAGLTLDVGCALAVTTGAGRGATIGYRAVFGLADVQNFRRIAFIVALGTFSVVLKYKVDTLQLLSAAAQAADAPASNPITVRIASALMSFFILFSRKGCTVATSGTAVQRSCTRSSRLVIRYSPVYLRALCLRRFIE